MMEGIPENGVQRLAEVIVEQRSEEDTPMLHLELEDSEDANIQEMTMTETEEIEQEVQEEEDMVSEQYIRSRNYCTKYPI